MRLLAYLETGVKAKKHTLCNRRGLREEADQGCGLHETKTDAGLAETKAGMRIGHDSLRFEGKERTRSSSHGAGERE